MQTSLLQLDNGLTTRVLDTGGDRPAVVLVHGLANALEIWERVLPRLSVSFRVIAFDLPGFGQASRPHAAYDGAFFAQQIGALLDTLGLARAHLVGSSLGASAIVRFSEQGLPRIDRAVLAAPGGFGRRTNLLMRAPALPLIGSWLGRPTPSNNALTLRLAIHDRRNITPELIALTNRYAAVPGSALSFVRSLQTGVTLWGAKGIDETHRLARQFDRPVVVMWGRQDCVFPAEYSRVAVALLPQAEAVLIGACGHYPHWEQPSAFCETLERFLL